jgi:hypothetical protein
VSDTARWCAKDEKDEDEDIGVAGEKNFENKLQFRILIQKSELKLLTNNSTLVAWAKREEVLKAD